MVTVQGPGPGEGLPEDSTRAFFQQLILALDFCQQLGIANRCAADTCTSPACPGTYLRQCPLTVAACALG